MMRWYAAPVPQGLPVRQVYGYLFDGEGRVLLQDDLGRFNLPGGKPEPGEEDYHTILARESLEESQVAIGRTAYLGYVRVEDPGEEPYAQVRLAGLLEEFLERAPDESTGRTYRRLMTSLDRAPGLLQWGEHGTAQAETAAVVAAASLGVELAGTDAKAEYVD
ncbi:NUDIX hydrolase [Kitasatospora sp. NPDC001683]